MADPERLLSEISDADEVERALLGSLQRALPPADAKSEAWARISAQIAAVGLVGAAHSSAAAAGSSTAATASGAGSALTTTLLGSKLVVGLALAASALGGSALWFELRARPVPAPTSIAKSALPEPLFSAVVPSPVSVASATDPAPPSPTAAASERPARPSIEASPVDRLNAESALLTQARAQLRSGDTAAASQSLARLRANFPKGVLGQEREVLAIEVLVAQGNTDAARRRAKAFILAHPTSPHSAQLSRFADAP